MTTTMKLIIFLATFFACLGWVVGLTLACLAVGETGVLRASLVPAIIMSVGLAAVFVTVSELANRYFGRGHIQATAATVGSLLLLLGLLVYVINYWLAPQIDRAPALARAITSLPGVYPSIRTASLSHAFRIRSRTTSAR